MGRAKYNNRCLSSTTSIVNKVNNIVCKLELMANLADRLRIAIEARGLNQPALARAASTRRQPVSQQVVQHLLSGRNKNSKHIAAIAKALRVRIEWLLRGDGTMESAEPPQTVPEIDFVRAGAWAEVVDPHPKGGEPHVPVSSHVGANAFALRVSGESMMAIYQHGDLIVVDPEVQPEPGDDVVAKLDGEERATFKQYRRKTPQEIELSARNPMYETLTMSAQIPGHIVGVVVEHHRYRRRS